jgi:DNA-binding Lrp family transcriptional regulator
MDVFRCYNAKFNCSYLPVCVAEGDVTAREYRLDQKDLRILTAIGRLGGKASTQELSESLGDIPPRTIRYRMKKLKEAKILSRRIVMTHERRMGLGESILVMQSTPRGSAVLPGPFAKLDPPYWYSPTYGSFGGFYVHCMHSLASPRTGRRILEAFQKNDLIEDFFIFDITDYEYRAEDLTFYVPGEGWNYDWDSWRERIEKNAKGGFPSEAKVSEVHPIVEFDGDDIRIIKLLYGNGEITQKEIADELGISEAQVNKRIHRLEDDGIVKGFRTIVYLPESAVDFTLFFEVGEGKEGLLSSFYEIPIFGTVMLESESRFGYRAYFPAGDFRSFLRGFDQMRPHLKWFHFQTVHHPRNLTKSLHPFDMFDEAKDRWETPASKYLRRISEILEDLE